MRAAYRIVRQCWALPCACQLLTAAPVTAQQIRPAVQDSRDATSQVDEATVPESARSLTQAPAQGVTLVPMPGLRSIFQDVVRDFGDLRSTGTLKWLGTAAVAAGAIRPLDHGISTGFLGHPGLDTAFRPGQTIGGAPLQMAAALATVGIGHIASSPRTATVGVDLLKAQLMSQALTQGLKISFQRTRPDGTPLSFPSGHASITFASATVLQRHFGWRVGLPAYAMASYVATSRIEGQRHYLSDVAFGAALGIVAGRAVTIGRGEHKLAISPTASAGGGGVSFTWLGRR
jgi:membrane-associated phospholipid phosphatase